MDIFTNGNEYFRLQLAKPLYGKGYEPIFPLYNIIIIERKYYYNRPFFYFVYNRNKLKWRIERRTNERAVLLGNTALVRFIRNIV